MGRSQGTSLNYPNYLKVTEKCILQNFQVTTCLYGTVGQWQPCQCHQTMPLQYSSHMDYLQNISLYAAKIRIEEGGPHTKPPTPSPVKSTTPQANCFIQYRPIRAKHSLSAQAVP